MNVDSDGVIDVVEKSKLLRTVNCMTVRHVFIMERLALIYSFFMHWGFALMCPCFGAVV